DPYILSSAYMDRTFSEREPPPEGSYRPLRILPETIVIKIGGQSIMDRGRAALMPILEEVVALKNAGKQLIVGTGGGTRARHIYSLALDLGLPTGVLAALGAGTPRQNAWMLQMLLAREGGVYVTFEDFEKLPLYFKLGCLPIMSGMPPFEYWEKLAPAGRIPPHRTDSGVYLTGEFLGSERVLFVKDEAGLYTADPKKDPGAEFIPRISVTDLLAMDLQDLVIERAILDYLPRARHVRQVQILNGLEPGQLTRAVSGEPVGTVISAD
ncbi:MAG: uridine kinase, partial [Cyanobacteria bacterium REEB65]|nr:uridine kinase [Cyanobacteria bacterium REEB65]